MSEFSIEDEQLASLKGKVVIVTGGSSGIGLATVQLLLALGAFVVDADLLSPQEPIESRAFTFHKTDVTVWAELLALFRKIKELHGHVDHVFANAGISPQADYLGTEVDDDGELKEPTFEVLDVNLRAVMSTTTLAAYHMRQNPEGGSVVMTCSIAGIQRFRAVDYATAKHGVLGYMRGMRQVIEGKKLPIRVNALAPSWTRTGVVPEKIMNQLGVTLQSASAVGRGAAYLMADESRNAQLVHIAHGKYQEIEEAVLLPAFESIMREGDALEDITLGHMMEAMGGVYKNKV